MKYPRSCLHQTLGPCERCAADFRARLAFSREVQRKGLRVMAAVQPSVTLAEWIQLDRMISRIQSVMEFVPEDMRDRTWEPLNRDELPE